MSDTPEEPPCDCPRCVADRVCAPLGGHRFELVNEVESRCLRCGLWGVDKPVEKPVEPS